MNFIEPVDLTADPIAAAQFTQQPISLHSAKPFDHISNTLEGLFIILLFVGYVGGVFWCWQHHKKRSNAQLRQIQTLERLWNMPSRR